MASTNVASTSHAGRHVPGGLDPVTPAMIGAAARWAPNTAYTAGQQVISPNNDVVTAKTGFTSTTTYNPANWNNFGTFALRNLVNAAAFGAVADSNGTVGNGTDNYTAYTAAKALADSLGYGVHFPPGKYRMGTGITLAKGQSLVGGGAGQPSDVTSAVTTLVFDTGVTGVTLAGLAAQLTGVMLKGGGSGNGVTVSNAGRTRLVDVSIVGFGGHGYSCDTSVSGNSNLPYCEGVHVYTCGGDGFHLDGNNSNAGTFIACEAVGNTGWGISAGGTARCSWVGGHLSQNTAGGITDAGNSNMYDVYIESGTGGTLNIDAASSYGIYWGRQYAMPTITGSANGASSWLINRNGATRGQFRVSDLADSGSGKTWKFDSGGFGAAWLGITNDTDAARLMVAQTSSAPARVQWYANVQPDATDTRDLGTTAVRWRDLFLSGVLHSPPHTTATRPTAASAGAGGTYFDTTLNLPQYSDGTNWNNAAPAPPAVLGIARTVWAGTSTALVTVGSANTTRYLRLAEGGTISKIRVSVGVASGNVCAAAYSNTGTGLAAAPGTQIATSGSVACPAAGQQDISLGGSFAVNAGDWLSIGADNVTATFAGLTGIGDGTLSSGVAGSQAVFPAPGTAAFTAGNNRVVAMVGVP